jgi:hypothetical protein
VWVGLSVSGLCSAVHINYFHVPEFVNRREEVTLECHFEMSKPHETLHSVKWYRIDHSGVMEEFFSFKPANNPPARTHERSGIKVDVRTITMFSYDTFVPGPGTKPPRDESGLFIYVSEVLIVFFRRQSRM